MHVALSLAALAVVVIAVVGACRRFDLPAPLVLVALGAGASFLPFVPEVHLTSEVVLVGLLPPLLYSAALQTSLVDFNANRRAILLLSIGLVAFTTVGVAVVAHLVIPAVSWPAAFALGAVVAPPDAVSATAIARRIGIPRRIVTILEGESLLNDATALVALRTAIGGRRHRDGARRRRRLPGRGRGRRARRAAALPRHREGTTPRRPTRSSTPACPW